MSAGLDIKLLLFTAALFALGSRLGKWEYCRMLQISRTATLAAFHKDGGWLRFVMLVTGGSLVGSMYVINRGSLWDFPAWLDLSLVWWCNGLGGIFFGLLFGLARSAWGCEKAPNTRALALTAALCGLGVLGATVINQRFAAPGLSASVPSGGELLLQSSNHSCAAASGANIASLLGIFVSEKQMAEKMGTRIGGTSPAGIVRGLRAFGVEGRKFSAGSQELSEVPVPSILLVDFPLLGPESHAIAALKFRAEDNTLEVWDPLSGRAFLSAEGLKSIWRGGHGIACAKRAAP